MNLVNVQYQCVKVGDTLFIKTEKNKKGEPQRVTKIESWETKSSHLCGLMYKLTFENNDEWFGWANRELKLYGNDQSN